MLLQTREALQRAVSSLRLLLGVALLLLITLLFGCGDDNNGKKDDAGPPLYGPKPAEAGVDGCAPVALYGPPPCTTDANCVEWMGEGWYCDTSNTFNDGCGNSSSWAICRQGTSTVDAGVVADGCTPVALYGPQPCGTDNDCVTRHGDGWYCDEQNTFGDGCGGTSSWPVCRQETVPDAGVFPDGCMPVALYGPQPCSADSDCVEWYGEGYVCDEENSFSDGCGNTVTWPLCEKP